MQVGIKVGFEPGKTRSMAQRQLEDRCDSNEKPIGEIKENVGKNSEQLVETQKTLALLVSESSRCNQGMEILLEEMSSTKRRKT